MVVAAAYRAVWDRLPGSTAWKIGLSAGVLTMTPLAAPPDPIYPLRSSRREQVADRRPARCTVALSVTTVWLGPATCSRRDTRQSVKRFGSGPIGGGGDSPLTHRPPGYRHDVHGRVDQSAAAVIVSTRADEPFFRGDDPERSPSHTVVASPRCAGEPTLRTN